MAETLVMPEVTDDFLPWSRDRRSPVEGAIIHAMGERITAGELGTFDAFEFLRDSPRITGQSLSVHALIHPDGLITRTLSESREAFHAGQSRFGSLGGLNRTFLGAEFLLPGEWQYTDFYREMFRGDVGYTDEQYEAGGWLYAHWMTQHGFGRHRVVMHSEVAGDNVRGTGHGKRDPGVGFNHGKLTNAINAWLEAGAE